MFWMARSPDLPRMPRSSRALPRVPSSLAESIDVPETYRKIARCPVLQNCKAATVTWTAKDGQITGKYKFTTDSEETATKFKIIVDGLKAMGNFDVVASRPSRRSCDGLTSRAKGDSFAATFTASTADIEAAIKAATREKKVCPLCQKECGPQENHKAITK